jgi:hypothetical protein
MQHTFHALLLCSFVPWGVQTCMIFRVSKWEYTTEISWNFLICCPCMCLVQAIWCLQKRERLQFGGACVTRSPSNTCGTPLLDLDIKATPPARTQMWHTTHRPKHEGNTTTCTHICMCAYNKLYFHRCSAWAWGTPCLMLESHININKQHFPSHTSTQAHKPSYTSTQAITHKHTSHHTQAITHKHTRHHTQAHKPARMHKNNSQLACMQGEEDFLLTCHTHSVHVHGNKLQLASMDGDEEPLLICHTH